ncbi:MAG: acyl-CoA thioesterase [Aquificae bacterium]|nr:acyl-CoA thioesterase [Aquificota bacterium]
MGYFVYERKVFFYETDAQGIVHHSNYPRYFEEARGFFLEQKGLPYEIIRDKLNVDIVLVELKIRYKEFLTFGDRFKIKTKIKKNNRFFFEFYYLLELKDRLICEGYTKHCCINRETKKIVSIPDAVSNLI